jgi:hypothetical protein
MLFINCRIIIRDHLNNVYLVGNRYISLSAYTQKLGVIPANFTSHVLVIGCSIIAVGRFMSAFVKLRTGFVHQEVLRNTFSTAASKSWGRTGFSI